MFGRISNAAAATNGNHIGGADGGQWTRGGGRGGRTVAGSALRQAGLIDEDVGMKNVRSSGPARRGGRGGESNRGGRGRGVGGASAGPVSDAIGIVPTTRYAVKLTRKPPPHIIIDQSTITLDSTASHGAARQARERANPLAGRIGRKKAPASADPLIKGAALNIRGAANGPGKGKGPAKGRVIGGDPEPASSSHGSKLNLGVLRRFLASRWNGAVKYINLDNMAQDSMLTESRVPPPGSKDAHRDIGTLMWKLISELYPDVATVSLASNDFKNLAPIMALPEHLPNLQNLSLENNDLKWTKDLNTFSSGKNGKFKVLRELILVGNPMQSNAASALNEEGYRAEVIAKFPTLTILDRVAVSPKEAAVAQLPSSGKGQADQALNHTVPTKPFPLQIKPGFSDEAANSIVPGFLHKYFTLFDGSRDSAELRAVYASNATWSLVLERPVPPRAKHAGYNHSAEMPRQKDLNCNSYKGVIDHNLMGLGTKAPSRGFPIGAGTIMKTLEKLPQTRHPITDPAKFVVDSWLLPGAAVAAFVGSKNQPAGQEKPDAVLFISVKGEFAEGPSFGVRSFDRTFIVAPSTAESPAATAGWPCTIIAEQMTVRHYSGIDSWKPDSLPDFGTATQSNASTQAPSMTTAAPPSSTAAGPAPAPGVSEQQHTLSLQFSAETGLTYPFAVQCLQENSWDPQTAINVFTSLKSQGAIPPEAFTR